jgi:hypothetical protein
MEKARVVNPALPENCRTPGQGGGFRFELHGNGFSGTGWSKSGGNGLAWSGTCASR